MQEHPRTGYYYLSTLEVTPHNSPFSHLQSFVDVWRISTTPDTLCLCLHFTTLDTLCCINVVSTHLCLAPLGNSNNNPRPWPWINDRVPNKFTDQTHLTGQERLFCGVQNETPFKMAPIWDRIGSAASSGSTCDLSFSKSDLYRGAISTPAGAAYLAADTVRCCLPISKLTNHSRRDIQRYYPAPKKRETSGLVIKGILGQRYYDRSKIRFQN